MNAAVERRSIYGTALSILIHVLILAIPLKEAGYLIQGTGPSEVDFLISSAAGISKAHDPEPVPSEITRADQRPGQVVKKGGGQKKLTEKATETIPELPAEEAEPVMPPAPKPAAQETRDPLKDFPVVRESDEAAKAEEERVTADRSVRAAGAAGKEKEDDLKSSNIEDAVYPETPVVSDRPSYSVDFGKNNGPRFLKMAPLSYPSFARKIGKEGKVVMRLTIDYKGKLKNVEVISKEGFGFNRAAVDVVRASSYLPAEINGRPATSKAILTIHFKLQKGGS